MMRPLRTQVRMHSKETGDAKGTHRTKALTLPLGRIAKRPSGSIAFVFWTAAFSVALSGCASGPPVPEHQAEELQAQSTAVDNLCKAEGDFAQALATQRDNGQSLGDTLSVIDRSPQIMNSMSPEFRAGVKEHVQKIYAHPEISPTQERADAVSACYSVHGTPSEPKSSAY
jgi:hypothetical protein